MEVLAVATKFHDPDVQWRFRVHGGEYILTVGSENDRIRLVFTPEELQQIFTEYAEAQLTWRRWITPEPPSLP